MKIWTLSDLHLDHSPWEPPNIPDADVCVVAGDICQGAVPSMEWIRHEILPHMPVVTVLGNHEFYSSSIERERVLAREYAEHSGIMLLDDSSVVIDAVRFVGATLWTDFDVFAAGDERLRHEYMSISQAWVNDFKLIMSKDFSSEPFTPGLARDLHIESRAYLADTLAIPFAGETVVVTHHAPSAKSIASEYAGSRLTPAFVSDLDDLIERHQPALWLHGHTHSSFDYAVGGTRIVCNPRGYGMENWTDYKADLVIEIGELKPELKL